MAVTQEQIKSLRNIFPCYWRVLRSVGGNAYCSAFIDADIARDVLDAAVGAENWQCKFDEFKGNDLCSVGIKIDGEWVWKSDVGAMDEDATTKKNPSMKIKGEASDAFKRAAKKWGVGAFTDALGEMRVGLKVYDKNGKDYPVDDAGKFLWDKQALSDFCNRKVRK